MVKPGRKNLHKNTFEKSKSIDIVINKFNTKLQYTQKPISFISYCIHFNGFLFNYKSKMKDE